MTDIINSEPIYNTDYKRRYEIINEGLCAFESICPEGCMFPIYPDKYETEFGEGTANARGGVFNFQINLKQMKLLVDEKFINLDDCKNESPTVQEFMEWASYIIDVHPELEKYLFFTGYAVSIKRKDYRTTIEGIQIHTKCYDAPKDVLAAFANTFNRADEFCIFPESMRCWYD